MTNPEEENQSINDEEEGNEEEQEFPDTETSPPELIISSSTSTGNDQVDELERNLLLCSSLFVGFSFDRENYSTFSIKVPNSILPLAISSTNGLLNSSTLVECTFILNSPSSLDVHPEKIECKNPRYGSNFPGSILLSNRLNNFFKFGFKPQKKYRCQCYALAPQNFTEPPNSKELIDSLVNEGFNIKQAKKALEFCNYDSQKAREYLFFGVMDSNPLPFTIAFSDNPIFYLTLEICEAFFEMSDCCCVCGKPLGLKGLKPACCSEEICKYSFLNLGVGSNIITEIKRDPLASDLIIALAGAACFAPPNPPVFDPHPSSANVIFDKSFFAKLPSMKIICERCKTDTELRDFLGEQNYEILRFFILANKAQLMTIPKSHNVNINVKGTQFLITSVSTESELIFRQKRNQYGVKWLWHGSLTDRWHRILYTGLKDYGQTEYTTHGPPYFGKGIYMSESFLYSYWYCTSAQNQYKNSALPKDLLIISLVENANTPGLTIPVTDHEYTQKDSQACITRVLFVMDGRNNENRSLDTNTLENPPIVPGFEEVLLSKIKKNT